MWIRRDLFDRSGLPVEENVRQAKEAVEVLEAGDNLGCLDDNARVSHTRVALPSKLRRVFCHESAKEAVGLPLRALRISRDLNR